MRVTSPVCRNTSLLVAALTALAFSTSLLGDEFDWAAGEFAGSQEEVEMFMAYNRSISLTEPQEAIRTQALETIPAPCCSQYSAATCCCECNLTRTIWGLAKFLITQREASVEVVRKAATAWIAELNPEGFSGDACFSGGCNKPFSEGGCGGMNEKRLKFR